VRPSGIHPILTPTNAIIVVTSFCTSHQSVVTRAFVRSRIVEGPLQDPLLDPLTCNLQVAKVQEGVYLIQVDVTAGEASLTGVAAKVSKITAEHNHI
jgi:hypothetical protein